MTKASKILLLLSVLFLTSALYIFKTTLYDYQRERNIEVVVMDKTQIHVPGSKNRLGRVDLYLIVQALSEVKDEAVLIEDHTFLRNSNTTTPGGSIKSKFITKIWTNGPVFHVPVNITDYTIQPIGTRMVFKVSQSQMTPNETNDKLGKLFLILLVFGSLTLILFILNVLIR